MRKYNLRKAPTLKKGPVKHSKRVIRRIKAAESLRGAIKAYKEAATTGYRAKLEAELRDGETLPDQSLALELSSRSVETAIAQLIRADHVYRLQAIERRVLNDACIQVARAEIYPELVAVRREIDARFGREAGCGVHGMEGATRRKPRRLQPQLEGLVTALAKRKKLPQPQRPGPAGERKDWLGRLEPGSKKLAKMLGELRTNELREAVLRQDRDFELECFDVDYAEALGYVRSVCRLAGLDPKLIWNLLPTVQRRHLKGKARRESEARAEGRRTGKTPGV